MEMHESLKYNTGLKGSLLFLCLLCALSCSDDDGPQGPQEGIGPEPTPVLPGADGFDGPQYLDDYTPLAGWDRRDSWNLANVHDPTLVKQGDYFYMFQTDASYGNVHEGHGHFDGRPSKDLVDWEYLGASMQQAPAWVKDSLYGNRARMGLPPIENPEYGYWAPSVHAVDGVYRMYYSIVVHELIEGEDDCASWGERPYIGLMETTDLASNQWEDKGMVITAVPDGVVDRFRENCDDWSSYYRFNAIDPSLIVTPQGE